MPEMDQVSVGVLNGDLQLAILGLGYSRYTTATVLKSTSPKSVYAA